MTEVTCPHCSKNFNLEARIVIPDEQRLSMEITSEGEHFSAKTLGGIVTEMDQLMKAVARDAGGKVETMVEGLSKTGSTIRLEFVIISNAVGKSASEVK